RNAWEGSWKLEAGRRREGEKRREKPEIWGTLRSARFLWEKVVTACRQWPMAQGPAADVRSERRLDGNGQQCTKFGMPLVAISRPQAVKLTGIARNAALIG
ncbi:hypothetical protein CLAIMM_08753, partial [Cladophialophora immunda]